MLVLSGTREAVPDYRLRQAWIFAFWTSRPRLSGRPTRQLNVECLAGEDPAVVLDALRIRVRMSCARQSHLLLLLGYASPARDTRMVPTTLDSVAT
jgi:hypothetical protein